MVFAKGTLAVGACRLTPCLGLLLAGWLAF
jgi:hypothetical protein